MRFILNFVAHNDDWVFFTESRGIDEFIKMNFFLAWQVMDEILWKYLSQREVINSASIHLCARLRLSLSPYLSF